jgi:hypothetical protein
LYGDEDHQLVILTDPEGNIAVRPVAHLQEDEAGNVSWTAQSWAPGFPLHLFEDLALQPPSGTDRAAWLSAWHTEHEWMHAVHRCEYSNAVIGITEESSPVAANVPGPQGLNPSLQRFERRRRELVQADFHVFASDHWNFNSRFPNPGGNHGSFFRISTHSVWMLSGAGIPARVLTEPYDRLNFASTILSLTGRKPPMQDRVVTLTDKDSGSVAHRLSPASSGSGSSKMSRMRISQAWACTKLAWLRADVGMITMSSVSIFTILQFNTAPLMLGKLCGGV